MKFHPLWLLTVMVTLVASITIPDGCKCKPPDNDQLSRETVLAYLKCMHGCNHHPPVKDLLADYIDLYSHDNVTDPSISSAGADGDAGADANADATFIDDYLDNDEDISENDTAASDTTAAENNPNDLTTRDRKCHRRCRQTSDCCHTDICFAHVCLGPQKGP
ncbi:uncharacterized protein BP01DRAFT_383766 [Aspergillus saccharolyticus JOP 1030-1]|uniref:Uncharacterized protein n=1 Tax=Aspergillus saccharolyticus JOP 1030-1 TaxID=1450539 RepID=A0A318ZI71_9EURO|nr:hypothetical protein BP01DRAFT_383766 [Aspergillus saccharolyticus JOP 1030-1]PYH44273.1 hypothetical protein BP01DRAFT_383766 [Aspergillus saccharolyticus JOP 1030-1]